MIYDQKALTYEAMCACPDSSSFGRAIPYHVTIKTTKAFLK